MGARLTVYNKESGHRYTVFIDASPLLIGRALTSDIRLPFPVVSSRHLRLTRDDQNRWTIEELGSTNGTKLNGQVLGEGPATRLSSGDQLTIGDVAVSFVDDAQQNSGDFTLAQTGTLARKLAADALSFETDDESAFIEVVKGPSVGTRLLIGDEIDELIIGSRQDVWLTLRGLEEEEVQIVRAGDGFAMRRQSDDEATELKSKDRIELGEHVLVFFDPLEALLDEPAAGAPAASTVEDPVKTSGGETALEPHDKPDSPLPRPEGKKEGRALGATEIGLVVFVALLFVGGIAIMLVLFEVI